MDYQNGKIYTIRSHLTDEIYIGSTTQPLTKRLSKHKSDYKIWKNGKRNYVTSFKIIDFGDAYIELLEECPCDSKMLLEKREGELIRSTACVNRCIAGRTKKEYYEDNKEHMKAYKSQWAKDNREKIKTKYHENKTNINEKRRIHMSGEGMKQKKKEQDIKYRTENKAKIDAKKKAKLTCPNCSKLITASNLKRHIKTQH